MLSAFFLRPIRELRDVLAQGFPVEFVWFSRGVFVSQPVRFEPAINTGFADLKSSGGFCFAAALLDESDEAAT